VSLPQQDGVEKQKPNDKGRTVSMLDALAGKKQMGLKASVLVKAALEIHSAITVNRSSGAAA
jgi:hypothetical protein